MDLCIAVAGLSVAGCAVLLALSHAMAELGPQIVLVVLLGLWILAALIGTFRKPFTVTSNGFFALW